MVNNYKLLRIALQILSVIPGFEPGETILPKDLGSNMRKEWHGDF